MPHVTILKRARLQRLGWKRALEARRAVYALSLIHILNRSEAIRNLIPDALVDSELDDPAADMVGSITLIYDHHTPDLTRKIDNVEHNYPDEIISSMHVHLDHHSCLEVVAVRGTVRKIDELANCLLGIKGIKYGKLTAAATSNRLEG